MQIKSFSKNTLFYAIGIIATRFTTFLLIPLYTEYLSKEEYGLLATLLFTTEIIITINDVGIRSAIMRFFADFNKSNKLNILIGSSTFVNVIVGIIIIIVSLLIPEKYLADLFQVGIIENVILLTILVGVARTLSLNILSYFRAKNNGIAYMSVSIATSIVLIAATWLGLASLDWGIIGVLYAQIFSYGLAWLLVLLRIYQIDGLKIEKHTSMMLLKFGYPLIFATAGTMLVNTVGNYFLGYFKNLEEVALLAVAYKVATIGIMVLIAPFQLAYEPYVFNNKNNPQLKNIISKILTYISMAYLLASVFILIIFNYLITLIGNGGYSSSYIFIILLVPGLGFTAVNYIGQSLIHLNNKTKTTGLTSFIVTVISIIIAYFLTKIYGTVGTIIAINFYLIISGSLILYFGLKEFPILIETKRISIIIISGIILLSMIYFLNQYSFIIFYLVVLPTLLLFIIWLLKGNFLSNNEKMFVKNRIESIRKFLRLS